MIQLRKYLYSPPGFVFVGIFLEIIPLKIRRFGPEIISCPTCARTRSDLFSLAEEAVASKKTLPRILSICGTEDFMIDDNRRFNDFMQQIKYPGFDYFEYPGAHTWEFWDTHIQLILNFFTTGKLPEKKK